MLTEILTVCSVLGIKWWHNTHRTYLQGTPPGPVSQGVICKTTCVRITRELWWPTLGSGIWIGRLHLAWLLCTLICELGDSVRMGPCVSILFLALSMIPGTSSRAGNLYCRSRVVWTEVSLEGHATYGSSGRRGQDFPTWEVQVILALLNIYWFFLFFLTGASLPQLHL